MLASLECPLPYFFLAWEQPGGGDIVRAGCHTQTAQCNWVGNPSSCLIPTRLCVLFWLADFWALGLGKQACCFTVLQSGETDLLLLMRLKHLPCFSSLPSPLAILLDNAQTMRWCQYREAQLPGHLLLDFVQRHHFFLGTDTKLAASYVEEAQIYQKGCFTFLDLVKKYLIHG